MSQKQIDILQKDLNREKAARKQSEKKLEGKSAELFKLNQELKQSNNKLERLLKETSTELKGVFDNILDASLVMDLYGKALKMNDAAINLFGFNCYEEDFNVLSLLTPENIDYAYDSFDQLYRNGQFSNFIIKIQTKDKVEKWIQINGSLIYDDNGMPNAAQGIIRDITASIEAKKVIEDQKSQLEIIVENSSLGIVLTQKGYIRQVNNAFCKILGYSKDELLSMTIKDITFPEDLNKTYAVIKKLISKEIDNFTIEKRYRTKKGGTILARTNVNAVRNRDSSMDYQVALIEDITSEKEKSLTINVLNEVAKSVLGKMDVHEIAWEIANSIANYLGTEDCVIYVFNKDNQGFEQIAAYNNKAIGKTVVDKITIPLGKGIVGCVGETGIPEIINNTEKDSRYIVDDDVRFSEITVPIYFNGEVIGVIDSEYKEKNFFNESHLETLQNVSKLVAMQLNNAMVLKEKAETEKKNEQLLVELAKSNDELQEYAHIVSHDLKSPLRSIYALVSWLKEDNKEKLNEVSMKNFEHIETSLEKMEQLITDVLSYSSIESGVLQKVDVNPNVLIKDLIKLLYVPEHIDVKTLNPLPVIKGDEVKLQQLFQNLISNSVKFIDKKRGKVEIDFKELKTHYEFSVKDNGIGIEKKFHKKIFKIFNKLNNSKHSTGIGLSIVKKIVNLHGGKVWLESEVDVGTNFFFTIKK